MMETGTIRADGRVFFDGCVDEGARLLAVNDAFIVVHHPGGTYYDNGGRNYVSARVEIAEIEDLRRGNAAGSWRFRTKRIGRRIQYHPTIGQAVHKAMGDLRLRGERIAERFQFIREGKKYRSRSPARDGR